VTSHDVVARVRREHGTRVGHAGTLDPFATGLLLILLGRMTRAQRFLMALPKTYRVVARLGRVSDTGDRDGELTRGRMPASLELPLGEIEQAPPAYSAVKVGGERAYVRARRGEEVSPAPRRVTVHRSELLWHEGDRAAFELEVSSGTYVRSLIAGLGDAYCEELERTAVGPFRLEDADPERLVAPVDALAFLPAVELSAEDAAAVAHGRRVGGAAGGAVRLVHAGELLAIAEPRAGELQPVVVFEPR
jgi:tRNA pseudouridine55 synthase